MGRNRPARDGASRSQPPVFIMYSIGNEIPNQRTADGTQLAKKLQAICHSEDPTRLVTSAVDFVKTPTVMDFLPLWTLPGTITWIDITVPKCMARKKRNTPKGSYLELKLIMTQSMACGTR
jgi:hypothetical protein